MGVTKTDIERAIRTLETCTASCISVENDTSYPDRVRKKSKELYEDYDTALAALHEMKERVDGCELCNGNVVTSGPHGEHARWVEGNRLIVEQEWRIKNIALTIQACPRCGRKLPPAQTRRDNKAEVKQ